MWPIHLKSRAIGTVAVDLGPGDAVVMEGTRVEHWRDRFPGNRHEQLLLFYTRQRGPYRHLKFDGRKRLGAPLTPLEHFLVW